MASGPVVAGVIGTAEVRLRPVGRHGEHREPAGVHGEPGRILVSEPTAQLLEARLRLSEPCIVTLKGKGPTPARFLLGRAEA